MCKEHTSASTALSRPGVTVYSKSAEGSSRAAARRQRSSPTTTEDDAIVWLAFGLQSAALARYVFAAEWPEQTHLCEANDVCQESKVEVGKINALLCQGLGKSRRVLLAKSNKDPQSRGWRCVRSATDGRLHQSVGGSSALPVCTVMLWMQPWHPSAGKSALLQETSAEEGAYRSGPRDSSLLPAGFEVKVRVRRKYQIMQA